VDLLKGRDGARKQLALDKHLPVLVAVEMTTTWKGEMTDLLCFGFDPNHSVFDPAAVVEAAHHGGAVCLLAHPGREDGFMTYDVQLLDQFRQQVPIDGLEVYYPAGD
jgi:predicted metal-dependent phosphoesterase TrpH